MKQSSMWMGIMVGSLIILSAVVVCTMFSSSNTASAAGADIDLEKLSKAYADHVQTNSKDLTAFEARVNKKDIYFGKGHVSVEMNKQGSVVGWVEKNSQPGRQDDEPLVFTIDADPKSKQIVSRDRNERYYGYHRPGLFTYFLLGSMIGSQHRYGRVYRPPSSARWMQSGYHSRLRSSSRSFRGGSSGNRRSGSGSFGSGK